MDSASSLPLTRAENGLSGVVSGISPASVILNTLSPAFGPIAAAELLLSPATMPIIVTNRMALTMIEARIKPSVDANIILKNCFIFGLVRY